MGKYEFRQVHVTISGKRVYPGKIVKYLEIEPDDWGYLGDEISKGRRCKQGYWSIMGKPCSAKLGTQLKNIVDRLKGKQKKLTEIMSWPEVRDVYLKIVVGPDQADSVYEINTEYLKFFTDIGVPIYLGVYSLNLMDLTESEIKKLAARRHKRYDKH